MNKTISINIGGFVFNIEENAYQKLYHYLTSIKQNFTEEEEREEIMNDIESRIAEIFQSKLSGGKEVIVEKDVDHVIDVMGKPEDYVSDEFTESSNTKNTGEKDKWFDETSSQKRLFRDTENAALGGVCSGLAHYFNLDVTLVRALFIIFTVIGGSGILAYLIMLFVVPEAKTTNDKLQMKGQSINVENIKAHFNKIKDDITENAKSGKFKRTFNQTFDKGVKASSAFVKTFSKIIGLAFVIGGIFALIILFTVLFGDSGILPMTMSEHVENLPTLLSILYPGDMQSSVVFISMIFVTMIPIISIIATGTKLLFTIKQSFKTVAIVSTVLWFVAVGLLVITGIDLGMSLRNQNSIEYAVPYADSSDVLFIDVNNDDKFSNHISFNDVWNHTELVRLEDESIHLGYPELAIYEKYDSGNFEITLYKKSQGMSNKDAIQKAENIFYKMSASENQLLLHPYYTIPKIDKLRYQRIVVEVQVPIGKKVKLGKNIDRIQVSISGEQRYRDDSFSNTTWASKGERLVCIECKQRKNYDDNDYDDNYDDDF